MLNQIISSLEKSKIKNDSVAPPIETKIHSLAGPSPCPACGGNEWWQPKRSDDWICSTCQPPRSERLVAQTRGGRQIVPEPDAASDGLDGFRRFWAAYRGPMIVWHTYPICRCGCDVTEEDWRPDGATKICVDCRVEVDFDPRVGVPFEDLTRLAAEMIRDRHPTKRRRLESNRRSAD